jgi:DNA-binding CsgD family transcriptional regulator
MALRSRPMQPKDVRECAEIIATHPVIGSRYGCAVHDLRLAWLRLLGCEAMTASVFEEEKGSDVELCALGVSVFVHDDFLSELKTRPFWVGPELARRVLHGDSPVLSDRQLREANSRGGLNLVIWEGCVRPRFEKHSEVYRKMANVFIESHRGYLFRELIASQMESVERFLWSLKIGGLLWDPVKRRYLDRVKEYPNDIIKNPHLLGTTRSMELRRPGSWVGALFEYQPPRFGFSPSEQRLLLAALSGATDEELSGELGISVPTVKKAWFSVYRRMTDRQPETIRDCAQDGAAKRGKEKRRHLLAYLREHPEELRPVSQKHLGQQSLFPKRIHRVQG